MLECIRQCVCVLVGVCVCVSWNGVDERDRGSTVDTLFNCGTNGVEGRGTANA